MAQTNFTVFVDLLNDAPWVDAMQRAIDLCAVAERAANSIVAGERVDPEPLFQAAREFRDFFEKEAEE